MDDDKENEIEEEEQEEKENETPNTLKLLKWNEWASRLFYPYFFFILFIYLTNTELKPKPKSKRWEYYYICAIHFVLVPIVGNNSTMNRYVKMKWIKIKIVRACV